MIEQAEKSIEESGLQNNTTPEIENKPEWTPNDDERRALANGWRPQNEYNGDPDLWKSAKLFNRDGELYDYISQSKKELGSVKQALQQLDARNQQIAEASYKRGLEDNAKRMREAAAIGDIKTVDTLREELVNLDRPQRATQNTNAQSDFKEENIRQLQYFKARNAWFDATRPENFEIVKYTTEADKLLGMTHPGLSPLDHFKMLEDNVKAKFSDRFNSPSTVAGDSPMQRSRALSYKDLPKDNQQEIQLLKAGLGKNWTPEREASYIKDLQNYGVI